MPISQDNYSLTIDKDIKEISELLSKNTLRRVSVKSISREITDKALIGQLNVDGFSVIGSGAVEVICKLNGKYVLIADNQTFIEIETGIQRIFKRLFVVLLGLTGIGTTVTTCLPGSNFTFSTYLLPLFLILIFRLFLHIAYVIARNKTIKKIETLLT